MTAPDHGYARIAGEYYDGERHQTTKNFRMLSDRVLGPWLRDEAGRRPELVLEVGAGRSTVIALCPRLRPATVVTDRWASMLAHTRAGVPPPLPLAVADATRLPFRDGAAACLVASLGAPFNTASFWREAARVLRVGARVLYTGPAHEWARLVRPDGPAATGRSARFVTASDDIVEVPSVTLGHEEQVQIVRDAGFDVLDVVDLPLALVPEAERAPGLAELPETTAVITGLRCRRLQPGHG